MARQKKGVFVVESKSPFVSIIGVDFEYGTGSSVAQVQKNIEQLHKSFNQRFPAKKVFEVSAKSSTDTGKKLNASNLMKFVPSYGKSFPVENIFHASKTYAYVGPFSDIYEMTPSSARSDKRLKDKSNGPIKSYTFDGNTYPAEPQTVFYNWLYINALLENKEEAEKLLEYDAFTDITLISGTPNSPARACALYVGLMRSGMIDVVKDFDTFYKLMK